MGTNYYWTERGLELARTLASDDVARRPPGDETHLGKASAAGWWCEACAVSLCAAGARAVHQGGVHWHAACPRCGAGRPALLPSGSQPAVDAGTPVRAVGSFNWAQDPEITGRISLRHASEPLIVDEYGVTFQGGVFVSMLRLSCRITLVDSIGRPHWS